MLEEEQSAEETAVSTIDTVVVVPQVTPNKEEPPAPDYAGTLAALELRIAALEAARVEELNDDRTDDGDDARSDADSGESSEAGQASEEPERPISRHWLFGKRW